MEKTVLQYETVSVKTVSYFHITNLPAKSVENFKATVTVRSPNSNEPAFYSVVHKFF